jgi:DHA3 family tetracycline resistance protein-like MFS transporter
VPRGQLVEANSLGQFVRPLALRFAGPALGGWLIAALGTGEAFLFDAATFAVSATAFVLMRTRSWPDARARRGRSIARDVREGVGFVRSQTWLWGTLVAVTVGMLFFLGPVYVLMPYIVKNELHGGADGLGLVFSAGGAGAIVASLSIGQRGLPRRPLTLMYVAWAVAAFGLVGYALSNAVWEAMLVSFCSVAGLTLGGIMWSTMLQRLVPKELLGRVSSIDWLLSFGLAPISYALVGPVSDLLGAEATLLRAGIVSGSVLLLALLLLLPGIRETESRAVALSPAS